MSVRTMEVDEILLMRERDDLRRDNERLRAENERLRQERDEAKTCRDDALSLAIGLRKDLLEERGNVEWLTRLVRMDRPWSIISVLERLADAADHLLKDHDCDTHGWEGIGLARDAAREIVRSLVGEEKAGTP